MRGACCRLREILCRYFLREFNDKALDFFSKRSEVNRVDFRLDEFEISESGQRYLPFDGLVVLDHLVQLDQVLKKLSLVPAI